MSALAHFADSSHLPRSEKRHSRRTKAGSSFARCLLLSVSGHHLGALWSGFALGKPPTAGIQIGRVPGRGIAMIRATVARALVLTATIAAALAPVTCLGEDS